MNQLSLFSVEPRAKGRRVQEPIARSAFIKDDCRFWLKRAWGAGPHILWIMLNPSEANGTRDDPTMLRVMEFSASWGFGSCTVVNLIPKISPTPRVAFAWLEAAEAGEEPARWQRIDNYHACSEQIDLAQARIVAWGNAPEWLAREWLQTMAEMADDGRGGGAFEDDPPPVEFLCLGTTMSGMPTHPLARGKHRIPDGTKPQKWTMP